MKKSHFGCQEQQAEVTGVYLVQGGKEATGVFSLALLAAIAQNFPTVLTMMWKVWQHVYFLALATAPPYKGLWPLTCLFAH